MVTVVVIGGIDGPSVVVSASTPVAMWVVGLLVLVLGIVISKVT